MLFGRSKLFHDPGTFWHIVVGERILSTGRLIYKDAFSFTRFGHPWIAQEWLGELIMALIHRIAGFDSLLLAAATLLASFYTWIANRLLRAGIHPLPAIFITAVTIAASSYNFLIRPLLATIVFMGITLAMLADLETGRSSLRRLFWLIALFVFWANIHGGYLGGMGTLLLVVGGWISMWLLGRDSAVSGMRQASALIALVILCGFAGLVSPYTIALPKAWYSIMNSPAIAGHIMEHMPLWTSNTTMAIVLPAALFYLAALAGVFPMWPRITWLIPLAWLGLGLARLRFAPLFATTFAIAIRDMLPNVRWFNWLSRKGSELCRFRGQNEIGGKMMLTNFIVPFMVIALILTFQAGEISAPVVGGGWAKIDPNDWPVAMLGELKAIEAGNPGGTRIFNDMVYGGFLIYYAPRLRVFIDDRCELYGDKGISEYLGLMEDPEKTGSLALRFGFKYALVQNSSSFDQYFSKSKDWCLIKRKDCAALYKRVSTSLLQPGVTRGEKIICP